MHKPQRDAAAGVKDDGDGAVKTLGKEIGPQPPFFGSFFILMPRGEGVIFSEWCDALHVTALKNKF